MEISLDWLAQHDRALFLWFNGLRHPALDAPMAWITGTKEWIPLYAAIIGGIFWKYRWRGLWVVGCLALAIVLCDQFASGFCKPFFARLRPCHEPDLQGLVHLLNGKCGGQYGFISSHAANTFGLAMFLFQLEKGKVRGVSLIFAWAALVSYSRLYAGVHYPADLLAGALSGLLWGWACARLCQRRLPAARR
jgi:undecaprenyl-diphosphatase